MSRFDHLAERAARRLAMHVSRRSFLARLGALVAGGAALPLLPVARGAAAEADAGGEQDPKRCAYWRHCAIDGFLCSCCGGSETACPPGTQMSPVTWIGTCKNPGDGRDYLISYNDCCGKGFCGRCFCNRNEGDRPIYYPHRSNDINWCADTPTNVYHCSTAIVIGVADEAQPEQ
jgi:methylamine dehydrogenase light chain